MITLSQFDHSNLYINARVSQFSPLLSATSSPDRAIAYASFSRAIKMENSGGRFFEKKKNSQNEEQNELYVKVTLAVPSEVEAPSRFAETAFSRSCRNFCQQFVHGGGKRAASRVSQGLRETFLI